MSSSRVSFTFLHCLISPLPRLPRCYLQPISPHEPRAVTTSPQGTLSMPSVSSNTKNTTCSDPPHTHASRLACFPHGSISPRRQTHRYHVRMRHLTVSKNSEYQLSSSSSRILRMNMMVHISIHTERYGRPRQQTRHHVPRIQSQPHTTLCSSRRETPRGYNHAFAVKRRRTDTQAAEYRSIPRLAPTSRRSSSNTRASLCTLFHKLDTED